MRIRAGASTDSFRREATLPEHLQQAEEHLAKLKAEADLNPNPLDARRHAAGRGTVLYAPLREEKEQLEQGQDPYAPKRRDSEAMRSFRARMGEAESKELYKLRGQSAEWTNACARQQGSYVLRVRGLAKVQALLFAMAHNLVRAAKLRAERTAGNRVE